MHVPKAAGTSITALIAEASGRQRASKLFDQYHFGRIGNFDQMDPMCRAKILFDPTDLLEEGTFLAGHLSLSTIQHSLPGAQIFSMFREPFSRILSHWLFCRAATEEQLRSWGSEWCEIIRTSRGTLYEFLTHPLAAAQSDNLTVRMLLRPHPLIPEDGFVQPKHRDALVAEATEKLYAFDFLDVIENPAADNNLCHWLGVSTPPPRLNEARHIPVDRQVDMLPMFDDETLNVLEARAGLDLVLWTRVLAAKAPHADADMLRRNTLIRYMLRTDRWMRV